MTLLKVEVVRVFSWIVPDVPPTVGSLIPYS
jgi:hypothetical protein